MTDPVRPVAPDEWLDLRMARANADMFAVKMHQHARVITKLQRRLTATRKRCRAQHHALSALKRQLAAAPVPCAASPADRKSILVDRDAELLRELRVYLDTLTITGDNIGDIRRSLFMPWDSQWNGWVRGETAHREARATGEGARDAELRNGEEVSRSVELVDRSAHASAGTVTGADRRGDLPSDNRHSGGDAPVAVSLDPHRLLPASVDDILLGAAILLEDFRGFLMGSDESYHTDPSISADALRQLAARLRGEATVRPIDRFEVIDETGRVLTRKPVSVELSYQDDGRTLKVFLKSATVRVEE